ncbi:hypothetical protein BLNAU_3859 [Blattamonas nauphoetae]|uniref:Uncharacterized protein n=1 Tax=Blattamonas nauphoetae TaxID=2049346 RepID=A0ABQ9YBD9_9EUKA|nr:hypothetical protein BLNAU_3859 [Blattamonas nauphoetae]
MAVSIPSPIVFDVPEPPSMANISVTATSINTFIVVMFTGSHLKGNMTVTLTSDFSFVVAALSDTSAVSEEMALGWPDSLAFATPFTIQSIVSTNPDSIVFLNGMLSFTTPKKPDSLSLFVDGRTGETSRFCGESTRPCLSVEVGWEIVAELGVRRPTIGIVHSATLGSPIRISNGMVALLSGSDSSALSIVASGQLEVGDSASTLKVSALSLDIESLTSARSAELVTLSAGSLIVSSCTVFASTMTLSISFVSLSNGKVSFLGSSMNIPTLTSKPFLSVSGGELRADSSTSFINSDTAIHQHSLLSVSGGTIVLENTKLSTPQKLTLTSSALIDQTKGSLTISKMKIENMTRETGDGSVIGASLTLASDTLSIESTSFASCSSSAGNGGSLAVTIASGSLSLNECRFERCRSGKDGGAVWLDLSKMPSPSQYSLLQTEFGTGTSTNTASGKGDCVYVVGDDLRRVIVGSRCRGSFEEAGEGDLWGRGKTTPDTSLLPLLQSREIGVGEGGRDDAAGTMDDPFETLHRCFVETIQKDGSFVVFVIERARIGKSCWLADQPGWSMDVMGSGGLSKSEVLCSLSDEEKQPGTSSSSARHAMITLSAQSLSFFDILFSSFCGPRWMGFVFSLLGSSQLTLSSCSLSSTSPITVSLVSASASSSFSASSFSMRNVSFVGKAGLVKFVDASRISLTSCSFLSVSLEEGGLLWGTTRGGIEVGNSEFTSFSGDDFGSVIRIEIVGITAKITNCNFTGCSTRVGMGEKGSRRVVGGGCVVVEMMKRTISTRRLRSSSVDLSLSSFSDCTLTNTDGSLSEEWLSSFVGGSGFLIFGNSRTDSAILKKVRVSGCVCVGFGKSGGFDGGVVVGLGFALRTDRRGSCVVDSGMGSIQLR